MTKTLDALMPAQHTTEPVLATGSAITTDTSREGVKSVAIFESRKSRVPRAWDELTELDRLVLLESVRQRRKAQEQKQKIYNEIYNLRINR